MTMDKLEHTELAIVRWRRRLRRALSELDKLEKRKLRYEKNTRRAEGDNLPATDQGSAAVAPLASAAPAPVETIKARKSKEQMKPKAPPFMMVNYDPSPPEARALRMKAMGFRKTKK